jgi:branched-chain amino acid transport system substrate-binding protein
MDWFRGLLAAGAVALAVAGTSAQAAGPIVIGVPLSQTGGLADSAEHIRKALLLWQEQANAKGGILGRQVELKMYDDKSDAATAVRLTERLITSDAADLLIAPFGSAATLAASSVAEKHKRVMMNVAGAAGTIHSRGFKYIFQVVAPSAEYVAGVFPVGQEHGYKTIAYISRDYTASRDLEGEIRSRAEKSGMKVVMQEYFPAGTTDYSSFIAKARDLKPDIWVSIAYPNECIEMIRQMKASNYLPKIFVSNGVSQEDFIKATGKDGEYAFGMSLYEPSLKTKGNEDFVREFKAKWNTEPGYYAAMGYATGVLLKEAVEKAGSTDQEKLRQVLLEMQTETPFGPFDVNEAGLQLAKKTMLVQVLNGKREIIWPDDAKTVKPVLPMPDWSKR